MYVCEFNADGLEFFHLTTTAVAKTMWKKNVKTTAVLTRHLGDITY